MKNRKIEENQQRTGRSNLELGSTSLKRYENMGKLRDYAEPVKNQLVFRANRLSISMKKTPISVSSNHLVKCTSKNVAVQVMANSREELVACCGFMSTPLMVDN